MLKSNGKWYSKSRNHPWRKKQTPIQIKQYKTNACKTCPVYDLCTRAKNKRGRVIERLVYAHLLEKNKQRMKEHYEIYRQRQAIVEHPFGTIKRQWGFDHIMTKKTIKRASADIGLVFVAYNLRRIFNILSPEVLKKYLSVLDFYFCTFQRHLKLIYRIIILKFEICFFEKGELKAA